MQLYYLDPVLYVCIAIFIDCSQLHGIVLPRSFFFFFLYVFFTSGCAPDVRLCVYSYQMNMCGYLMFVCVYIVTR